MAQVKPTPTKPVTRKKTTVSSTRKKTSTNEAKKTALSHESPALSIDQKRKMIAEAAYFIAEKRGFVGGDPDSDWLEAETQIENFFEEA